MDRIQKSLKKLSAKERKQVKDILERVAEGNTAGLDLQKLTGAEDVYRVRKGDIRIIYLRRNRSIFILAVERRSEKTYRDI